MATYLKIDGLVMPTPSDVVYKTSDLHDNATRNNAMGQLVVDKIRSNIRALNCTWLSMTVEDMVSFYATWGEGMFHTVSYFDNVTGAVRSGTFYRGDVTASAFRVDTRGNVVLYLDVKINFIER